MNNPNLALEIYDRFSTLENVDTIENLYRKVITHPSYAYDRSWNESKVMEIYLSLKKDAKDILFLSDIVAEVYGYNSDIFYNIALLELLNDRDVSRIGESEIQEILDDMVLEIEEAYIYNTEYYNLSDYVAWIIENAKDAFIITEDEPAFDSMGSYDIVSRLPDKSKSYEVLVSDCQNVLIPDFARDGFLSFGDTLVYKGGVI